MKPSPYVRLTVFIPRTLHEALRKAAEDAGERTDHAIIKRLQSSLGVDDAKLARARTEGVLR